MAPTELARALTYGMRGFRDAPSDDSDMRRLIGVPVEALMRAINIPRTR